MDLARETCQLQFAEHKRLFCKAGMTKFFQEKERGWSRHVTGHSLVLDTLIKIIIVIVCCVCHILPLLLLLCLDAFGMEH